MVKIHINSKLYINKFSHHKNILTVNECELRGRSRLIFLWNKTKEFLHKGDEYQEED